MTPIEMQLLQDLRNELTRVATIQGELRNTTSEHYVELRDRLDRIERNGANGHRGRLAQTGAASIGGGGVVFALVEFARAMGWF